jgi:hypothetical protein
MSIVDEAVQDGIGVGGIPNNLMPGGQRKLGGDDRRPAAVSLLKDFEQIMTGAGVERLKAEVVENEQIGAAEGFYKARMTPVAACERQVLAQLRPAMIEDGAIVAAGFLADGASQPALADAGWADQGQIVVGVDPILPPRASGTGRDRAHGQRDSRHPRRSPAGAVWRRAVAPSGVCPSAMTPPVEEQSEPVSVGQVLRLAGVGEINEGLGHSIEAEGVKLIEGRMFEQVVFS